MQTEREAMRLTAREREIIKRYRRAPACFQLAIDKLLNIEAEQPQPAQTCNLAEWRARKTARGNNKGV